MSDGAAGSRVVYSGKHHEVFARDLQLAHSFGLDRMAAATSGHGYGIEVAYRSTEIPLVPLVNVGWKVRGQHPEARVNKMLTALREDEAAPCLAAVASSLFLTGRGFLTLRRKGAVSDVFVEVLRCDRMTDSESYETIMRTIGSAIVGDNSWLSLYATNLADGLREHSVRSFIAGWELAGGSVVGSSLYINRGSRGRWGLWRCVEQCFSPEIRGHIVDVLGQSRYDETHSAMYVKRSSDGSASIHVRGLSWDDVDRMSTYFGTPGFATKLSELYDFPPDVLCLAARQRGDIYCAAYFQHYISEERTAADVNALRSTVEEGL